MPLVAGVVLGFGLGWAWPGLMNFAVVRLHPQAPAAATSITQTGVYAGGCLGPLGLGAVAAHVGYPTMWRSRRWRCCWPPPSCSPAAVLLARRTGTARPPGDHESRRTASDATHDHGAAGWAGTGQLVRSAMKSQSDSRARRAGPSGSGASGARASSA